MAECFSLRVLCLLGARRISLEQFAQRQFAFDDGGRAFQSLLAHLDQAKLKEYPHPAKRVRGIDSLGPALTLPRRRLGRCE